MAAITKNISDDATTQETLFTCLSCSIAFTNADAQREHYRSDHHRYNMKRRVAGLPPVSAHAFNEKILERRAETAVAASAAGSTCQICNKIYTTENAYRSHVQSKKHKENELKASLKPAKQEQAEEAVTPAAVPTKDPAARPSTTTLTVDADATTDEIDQTIDEKIAAARNRLAIADCLFCPVTSPTLEENLTHMSLTHGFFVPEATYLIDLPGLITYLGEKVAVGNVCIFCNGKGREFRTLDAVRKHMTDKSHCKIAYDEENDRLEISDFYDFSSSYQDMAPQKKKSKSKGTEPEQEEWEDLEEDNGEDVDEVVEIAGGDTDDDEELPDNELTYGDSHLELVLPSGARIGHRSMRRYYAQTFRPSNARDLDPNSGAGLVRRLLADKNSALIPRGGGFGAFGGGTDIIKARNPGEAREAGRHIREFRDVQRREQFKTKVGFIGNHQKHFREPFLQ